MNGESNSNLRRTSKATYLQDTINKPTVFETSEYVDTPADSTYELILWLFSYCKLFLYRLGRDLLISIMYQFYSDKVLPDHIVDLTRAHKALQIQRELNTAVYSRHNIFNITRDLNNHSSISRRVPKTKLIHDNPLKKLPNI